MRGLGLIKGLFGGGEGAPADQRTPLRVDAREGLNILVVDDSSTVVALLGKMLRQNAYTVSEATDGEQALTLAEREPPDLMFLDIVLPRMSGFAVLRALRREPRTRNVPVIMMSGNLHATEEFYGQRIGADDFLQKPFGRGDVFARIQKLVEQDRLPARAGPVAIAAVEDEIDVLVHDDAAPQALETSSPAL